MKSKITNFKFQIALAALCAFAPLREVSADTLALRDGSTTEYRKIIRAEPDGLSVMTKTGIEKIPVTNLTDETRAQYKINAGDAAAYAAQRARAQAAFVAAGIDAQKKLNEQNAVSLNEPAEKKKAEEAAKAAALAAKKQRDAQPVYVQNISLGDAMTVQQLRREGKTGPVIFVPDSK